MPFTRAQLGLYLQALAHNSYIFVLLYFYDGDRHLVHYLYLIIFGLLVDYLFQKIYKKPLHFNLSVVITCSTCYMLVVTRHTIWPYYLATLIAIASKYLITVDKKHIFNPGNFGMLACLCLFSDDLMMSGGQWLGSTEMMIFFALMGAFVSIVANRWVLSLVYITTFLGIRLVMHEMTGLNMQYLIGPILSVAGFIFTFHMITDPKTSPASIKGQVVFGLSLAFLDLYLRQKQIIFASVLSLGIICAVRALLLNYTDGKVKEVLLTN